LEGCQLNFHPFEIEVKTASLFCVSFSCCNALILGSSWQEERKNKNSSAEK
jgi:hypothetical protein